MGFLEQKEETIQIMVRPFVSQGTEVAYLSNNKLYVTQAEILTRLQIGKFTFEPQANGNLSLIYTG